MAAVDTASTIITTGVVVAGFALNAWVQYRNGRRADKNARAQSATLEATYKDVGEVKEIVGNVKENTDGRLTEVLLKFGQLEESLKDKTEENAQLRIEAASVAPPPPARRRSLAQIDREITKLESERDNRP